MDYTVDEKGFVFLDGFYRPYYVRQFGGDIWMAYWHRDNKWVTLRKLEANEIPVMRQRALLPELAEAYHKLNQENDWLGAAIAFHAANKPEEQYPPRDSAGDSQC